MKEGEVAKAHLTGGLIEAKVHMLSRLTRERLGGAVRHGCSRWQSRVFLSLLRIREEWLTRCLSVEMALPLEIPELQWPHAITAGRPNRG
jgi:hypothetical protein